MPIDITWVRGLLENTAIVWVDGGGGMVDAEEDVLAMLTEIEQLRAQVAEFEAAKCNPIIGDKVRLIKDEFLSDLHVGDIGTVRKVIAEETEYSYLVEANDKEAFLFRDEFEVITDA